MKKFALTVLVAVTALASSAYAYKDGDVLPCGKIYRSSTQTLSPDPKTNARYIHPKSSIQSGGLLPGQGDGVYKAN